MAYPLFQIYYLSEYAVTLQFADIISEATLQQVYAFDTLIKARPFPGFLESVPAYTTLSIFYHPALMSESLPGRDGFEKISRYLTSLQQDFTTGEKITGRYITIPVCYGGPFGPDIEAVAQHNGLTPQQVIEYHSSGRYKVYMMGFVPGFAYLGGMDARLATPRKEQPRKAVLAGSVGIAGEQTGIYPLEIPGGWQIIGRTPLRLFDVAKPQPALLQAGDEVKFTAIDGKTYETLSSKPYADSDD